MLPSPAVCAPAAAGCPAAPPAWRPSAGRCCRAAATRATSALFTRERTLCPRIANSSSEPPVTSNHKGEDKTFRAPGRRRRRAPTPAPLSAPEGAQQAQREGADGQQQRPRLKPARCSATQRVQQWAVPAATAYGGVLHRPRNHLSRPSPAS